MRPIRVLLFLLLVSVNLQSSWSLSSLLHKKINEVLLQAAMDVLAFHGPSDDRMETPSDDFTFLSLPPFASIHSQSKRRHKRDVIVVDAQVQEVPSLGVSMDQFMHHYVSNPGVGIKEDEPLPDPVFVRTVQVTNMMRSLRDRFLFQLQYIDKINDILQSAVRQGGHQVIVAPQVLRDLKGLVGSLIKQVIGLMRVNWQGSPLTLSDMNYKVSDLELRLKQLMVHVLGVEGMIPDVAIKSQAAVMTGQLRVIGTIEAPAVNASSLMIHKVSHQRVSDVVANAFNLKRPKVSLKGKKEFTSVIVRRSVGGHFVNGVDLKKDAFLVNRAQNIAGPVKFASPLSIAANLNVREDVNGIDLTKDVIQLRGSAYGVLSPKRFLGPVTYVQSLFTSLVSGVDLNHLARNGLSTEEDQVLSGVNIFKRLATGSITAGHVNRVDLDQLAKEVTRIDQPSSLRGKKTLSAPRTLIRNELKGSGRLNGLRIPGDLLLTSVPQRIPAFKRFHGEHTFEGALTVLGAIDGLRLPHDIVTLTTSELMASLSFAKGCDAQKDVEPKKLIDGVDISSLSRRALKITDKKISGKSVFRGAIAFNRNVDTNGLFNGLNVAYFERDVIYSHSRRPVVLNSRKVLGAPLSTPHLMAQTLNGVSSHELVKTRFDETVFRLVFDRVAFNETTISDGRISGVNIMELNRNRISLFHPGSIVGSKNYVGLLRVSSHLTTNGKVNGIKAKRDLVLRSTNQHIGATKLFASGAQVAGTLSLGKNLVSGRIDGLNVSDLMTRRVSLNKLQVIPTSINLASSRAHFVSSSIVNGFDVQYFLSDILYKDGLQTVTGHKVFRDVRVFENINAKRGVNGINLNQLDAIAVHTHSLSVIKAPAAFANSLTVGRNVSVYGLVNSINLNALASDSVTRKGHVVITGNNRLVRGSDFKGNIHANLVNGYHLPSSVMLKTSNQTVSGTVVFNQRLRIGHNLNIRGLVNGIDISAFDRNVMKTNRANLVKGSLVFTEHVHTASEIRVKGTVDGIKLSQLSRNTLYKVNEQRIHGTKRLRASPRFMSDIMTAVVNNVSIPRQVEDMVSTRSRTEVTFGTSKEFLSNVKTLKSIVSRGGPVLVHGFLNGINLYWLVVDSIPLNKPTTLSGVKEFLGNTALTRTGLRVLGKVNGVDLLNDVLLLCPHHSGRAQVVRGRKRFQQITALHNIAVEGYVNGLRLPALALNTFYVSRDQLIRGNKAFMGRFMLQKGMRILSLNGMSNIRSKLVRLNGDQEVSAQVAFQQTLRIRRNLYTSGLIGGVNLTLLSHHSWLKDVPQIISAPITFEKIIFWNDVRIEGPVNGIDLSEFSRTITGYRQTLNASNSLMNRAMSRHLLKSDKVFNLLEKSKVTVDSFSMYQELEEVFGDQIEVHGRGMFSFSELDEGMVNSTVHQIRYNHIASLFEVRKVDERVPFVKRVYFFLANEEFVIHKTSFNSDAETIVKLGDKVVASIGAFVDDSHILVLESQKIAIISTLIGVKGQIKVFVLKRVGKQYSFKAVAALNVGPSATKMVAFNVDDNIYLAVARSFKKLCAVTDSGSLVFLWEEMTAFKLIQRIAVRDSNNVAHYSLNEQHYLVFTDNSDADEALEHQSISVFRSKSIGKSCQFSLYQRLVFDNLNDLSVFGFGPTGAPELFLAAVNTTTLQVWRQDGYSAFTDSWSMRTNGGQVIEPLLLDNKLFILVGQKRQCIGSVIFKANLIGSSLLPLKLVSSWESVR